MPLLDRYRSLDPKYRTLVWAMLLFIGLELMMVALFAYFARQVADNAVTASLSGKQRMLSERSVRALLVMDRLEADARPQAVAMRDLAEASELFSGNLDALDKGGPAPARGGTAMSPTLAECAPCKKILTDMRGHWSPLRTAIDRVIASGGRDQAALAEALQLALQRNERILELSNELTAEMERRAVHNANRILQVQAVATVIAIANFLFIMLFVMRSLQARMRDLRRNAALLEGLRAAEADSLLSGRPTAGFDRLIEVLLDVGAGTEGFIAELGEDADADMHILAAKPASWPVAAAALRAAVDGMGEAPATIELENAAGAKLRFLCIPLTHDGRRVGIMAIAAGKAKRGGAPAASPAMLAFLQPLIASAAQMIAARRIDEARRLAEQRSHELAEQLKVIGDNIPGGAIYQLRRYPDGRAVYLYASEGFRSMLGVAPEDILRDAVNLHRHRHPDDAQILDEARETSRRNLQPFDCTYRRIAVDGRVIWTHVRSSPRLLDDGSIIWNGVVLDVTDRKKQEAELAEREGHLQRLMSQVPGMVYQFQMLPDGRFIMPYASEGIRELIGYTLQEVRADPRLIFAAIHAEDRPGLIESIHASARDMARWEYEYRVVLADGSVEWRHGNSMPERQPDGSILWHGFLSDITRRRQAQEKLDRFTRLMDHSQSLAQVGGWELNVADGTQFWTPETYRIHDTSPEEHSPTMQSCLAAYTPESLPAISAAVADAVATGSSFDLELQIVTARQRTVWVRVSSSAVVENGRVVRLMGAMQDISTRKQAEAALVESERLFSSIFDTANDAFITVDSEQRIMLFNKAAERMFGYTAAEIKGQSLERLLPKAERGGIHQERIRAFGAAPGTARRNVSGVRANGEVFPAETSVSHLTVGSRQIFAATIRDTTERQRTEALQLAKEAAELANRTKSEFLAHMSHELRTPLNSILGFAQLLEYDSTVRATEAVLKKVRNIHTAGAHLLSMIDDVLDLSRIEIGGLTLSTETIDLDALIHECVALIAPQAESRRLKVSFEPGAENGHVRADRTRLRQVLVNLLSNAVKYNRQGGAIDISRRPQGNMLELAIRDSGRGLSAAQQERLFQPFNRLGAEMSNTEGTGIGLVIARQLVEKMGGSIAVRSKPDEGSTFTVTLPAAGDLDAALSMPPDLPSRSGMHAAAGARRTILYIEDNPANVELIQQFLAMREDFHLEIETEGIAGLSRALQIKPDLLLLDINLPGMDGFEIMRRLRLDPAFAGTPVVALSANAMPEEVRRASELGFAEYLTKPIDLQRLLATIVGALDAAARR